MHHLTSHGFVVLHRIIREIVLDYGEDQVPMIKVWRAQDNQASISALEQLEWSEQVNTENIILSGHSFGLGTTGFWVVVFWIQIHDASYKRNRIF